MTLSLRRVVLKAVCSYTPVDSLEETRLMKELYRWHSVHFSSSS